MLYEEKFAAFPAWIAGAPDKSVGPSGLAITATTANTTWIQGPPDPYANAEICVTVSAQAAESTDAVAGLAFYVFNNDTYYRVAVTNINGELSVERRMGGQWTTVVPYITSPAIRKGPTAENEVSVKLSGSHALVSVNDTAVVEFDATAIFVNDKRQSYVDILWASFATDKPSYKWAFQNFQVRELQ